MDLLSDKDVKSFKMQRNADHFEKIADVANFKKTECQNNKLTNYDEILKECQNNRLNWDEIYKILEEYQNKQTLNELTWDEVYDKILKERDDRDVEKIADVTNIKKTECQNKLPWEEVYDKILKEIDDRSKIGKYYLIIGKHYRGCYHEILMKEFRLFQVDILEKLYQQGFKVTQECVKRVNIRNIDNYTIYWTKWP